MEEVDSWRRVEVAFDSDTSAIESTKTVLASTLTADTTAACDDGVDNRDDHVDLERRVLDHPDGVIPLEDSEHACSVEDDCTDLCEYSMINQCEYSVSTV